MREEEAYEVPRFVANDDGPLLYVSFGSLGAGDTELLKRIIAAVGKSRFRALVNVGDYAGAYSDPPPNVHIAGWYPQPSVIPQTDVVIHHGGNNSFTECLYFGKPAIIMPYVWDGHDNATRVQETGHGLHLDRYEWNDEALLEAIETCLGDLAMHSKLRPRPPTCRAGAARKRPRVCSNRYSREMALPLEGRWLDNPGMTGIRSGRPRPPNVPGGKSPWNTRKTT